jgi:hypothetical protein
MKPVPGELRNRLSGNLFLFHLISYLSDADARQPFAVLPGGVKVNDELKIEFEIVLAKLAPPT